MCLIPAACPPAWARRLDELSGAATLDVAGLSVRVEITRERLERTYLPVLGILVSRSIRLCEEGVAPANPAEGHEKAQNARDVYPESKTARMGAAAGRHRGPGRRLLAGLAGIGAGGKSTLAAVLAHLAGRLLGEGRLVVVGMDGWHFPNSVLDARWTTDAAGRPIPLRRRKGGPDSYDVSALAATLRELRVAGRAVSVPVYDRRVHDPVAGGLDVPAGARIVLLEGNYLLADWPPWDEVSSLLDVKLFLECDVGAARERMIGRHIRGGLSMEQALAKYEENDGPNAGVIAGTAGRADYVIRLAGEDAPRRHGGTEKKMVK